MDTKKWEQLVTLYLNEGNEEKARALFHDIIVEKSREIYESMLDVEENAPVNDLMDEISTEEEGMDDMDMDTSDEESFEYDDMEDEDLDDMEDIDSSDMEDLEDDDEAAEEDLEDRVVDIEDKIDQLMRDFEKQMSKDDEDVDSDEEDMEADEEDMEADEEDMGADEDDMGADEDEEEEVMESVTQLKPYHMKKNADVSASSPSLHKPGVNQRAVPVMSHGSPAGRTAPSVKTAGMNYGNSMSGSKKLKSVGKPAPGEQPKGKSPIARPTFNESRKSASKQRV